MNILGLDQGTTSTRALWLAEGASPRIVHAIRHGESLPQPGHHEQDAEELVANLRQCIAAAPGRIDAIGMANQGESCLAWDAASGQPLTPVITWQDNRTASDIERLKAAGVEAAVQSRSGLPLDPYFSASKLGWIMSNCDAAQAALREGRLRLGTSDAFFLDRLTGQFATDVTTASRTSLMDRATGLWDAALCRIFGVPIECLPPIRATMGDFGSIDGVPVRASAVDQQAALWGHGCRTAGEMKITFGTGAFALALTDGPRDPAATGLLPTVAWSDGAVTAHALEGGVYDAGAAIEWAQSIGIVRDIAELDALAGPPAVDAGLIFVPALSGLACPHWDRSASALWIGMTKTTGRTDLVKALLEGIAFRTAEVVAAMDTEAQVSASISIDGGLSRSRYFCQFLADILQRTIARPQFDELTALGCAWMARTAAGVPGDPRGSEATLFHPAKVDVAAWRSRHAEAVARGRGWR